ncbi:MAG: glycosyltransferase family 4 protein [Aestuariibacter sp.]
MSSRFLLISNMYPGNQTPSFGIFVQNIETGMVKAGLDVKRTVISGKSKSKFIKLFDYALFLARAFCSLMFTKRTIYIHFIAHTAIPLLIMSMFRKFKVVAHVHGGDVIPTKNDARITGQIKRKLAQKTLSLSEKVIVPSHWMSAYLQREFGVSPNKVFVSPSGGISTETFYPEQTTSFTRPVRFGYIGRLDSGKGVDTMLKAMALVDFEFECEIVGTGKQAQLLVNLSNELGLDTKVTFTGEVAHADLRKHYLACDFFIFPSELQESLGLVGLEAMACGKPVIGSGIAGMGDYLKSGINGMQFSAGESTSLAPVLSRANEISQQLFEDMSANALDTAKQFDARKVNSELVTILRSI